MDEEPNHASIVTPTWVFGQGFHHVTRLVVVLERSAGAARFPILDEGAHLNCRGSQTIPLRVHSREEAASLPGCSSVATLHVEAAARPVASESRITVKHRFFSPRRAPLMAMLATFVVAASALACSVTVEADSAAQNAQKLSVIDVRVHQPAPVVDALSLDASARFVSVRAPGTSNDALDLLGLSWTPLPIGACMPADAAPAVKSVRVDLRDLSPVALELSNDVGTPFTMQLEPKAFPDVAGLVSGVVFSATPGSTLGAAPRFVSVKVPNGSVGGLELPELPPKLQLVDATPIDGGTYGVDARGLDVVAPSPAIGDRLEIDVVRGGLLLARCGLDTTGRLHVDAASLGGTGDATLVLRAQRRTVRDDAALGTVDARLERSLDVKILVR